MLSNQKKQLKVIKNKSWIFRISCRKSLRRISTPILDIRLYFVCVHNFMHRPHDASHRRTKIFLLFLFFFSILIFNNNNNKKNNGNKNIKTNINNVPSTRYQFSRNFAHRPKKCAEFNTEIMHSQEVHKNYYHILFFIWHLS